MSNPPQSAAQRQHAAQQMRQQSGQWPQNRDWQARDQYRQNVQNRWNNHQNGPQPFTRAWYAQHPNAWHAAHPYAYQRAATTAAALGAWLGWAAAPQESSSSTTVIYDDTPNGVEETDIYTNASPAEIVLPEGDWLPLGVYSIVTAPDQPSMQLVQLAVDRNGVVRGVYYDAMTNSTHSVVGSIDRATQRARWTLESNPNLSFTTGVEQLTQPDGMVEVMLPSGTRQWQLVRLADSND